MPDRYTYPGTDVLVNIPGWTERDAWKDAETAVIMARLSELLVAPLAGGYDLDHVRAIHAHLVKGFYTWGGQLRGTDTTPGGTGITHCRPQFIPAEAERIFTALAERDYLRGLDADAFSAGLAWVWSETTVLHPFRDVNTRSQFVFFNQLAHDAGWAIDWSLIDPYLFGYARTVSMVSDERGIDALLRPALRPLDGVETDPELADRVHEATRTFFTRSAPRTFAELDRELRQVIEHRASDRQQDPGSPRAGLSPPDSSVRRPVEPPPSSSPPSTGSPGIGF